MKLNQLIIGASVEMSGLADKLKALKEKLEDFLPEFKPQGSNKKQLIFVPLPLSQQGNAKKNPK
ncbi:MAG: hypothetical protein FJY21_06355 [Bacteroidetes bacterium]|nr:hypothetical protein [Bacteroidota bacterium]